jgi:hypothetical protein
VLAGKPARRFESFRLRKNKEQSDYIFAGCRMSNAAPHLRLPCGILSVLAAQNFCMNKNTGIVVAVVVVLAAGLFYFWPMLSRTPEPVVYIPTPSQEIENSLMLGVWRSNTDAKFTREIDADGVMIDRYDGISSAGTNGEWSIVDPATETGLSVPSNLTGKAIIKVVWEGGVETTYFVVNDLTTSTMTTTDLTGTGSVTVYTKVR